MLLSTLQKSLLSAWLCCVCSLALGQQPVDLLIVGGNRFDTAAKTFVPNSAIAIKAGLLASVDGEPAEFSASETIELTGDDYILPGLVDCHAHYNVRLIKNRREEFEVMPIIYLANGVTTTFSCGEFSPEKMRRLRLAIQSGQTPGPHLLNSGPYFGRARPGWRSNMPAEEIKAEVDYWVNQGVGGFKAKSISPEQLRPLIEQAHSHGLTVTGHLDSGYRNSVNPRDAIQMGIDRIEHFIGGDAMPSTKPAYSSLPDIVAEQAEYKKAVQQFIDSGTVFDATLTAYGYPGLPKEEYEYWIDERLFFTPHIQAKVLARGSPKPVEQFEKIYAAKLATVGEFFRAGGTLSLGTDHVSDGTYLPGFGAHRELDAFVRAGIPSVEALLIGTINGARALGVADQCGSIEIGKQADLMVVQGNPIADIRHTRNVHTVLVGGQPHKSQELLASVQGKLGPQNENEESDW